LGVRIVWNSRLDANLSPNVHLSGIPDNLMKNPPLLFAAWLLLVAVNFTSVATAADLKPWAQALKDYGNPADGLSAVLTSKALEKNKNYTLGGSILQVGKDFILVTAIDNEPYAIVEMDSERMSEVPLNEGDPSLIIAVFWGYEAIEMTDGSSHRLPVFALLGLESGGKVYRQITPEEEKARIEEEEASAAAAK
jgi:hypothetical protein